MRQSVVLLCVSFLFCGGCQEGFKPASELLDNPQMLAIRATPPAVNPGGSTRLDALVHWPGGTPVLTWIVCVPEVGDTLITCLANQLGGTSTPPFCAADPGATLCVAGAGGAANYDVPLDIFPDDGKDHTFFLSVLAADGFDGFETCGDVLMGGAPTTNCLLSLKRVVVSYDATPLLNENPVTLPLLVNGEEVSSDATVVLDSSAVGDVGDLIVDLGVNLVPSGVDEMFPADEDPEPHDLVVSWFTTCNHPSDTKTYLRCTPGDPPDPTNATCEPATNRWSPKQTGLCDLYAVIRDGRGGTSWIHQRFEVR